MRRVSFACLLLMSASCQSALTELVVVVDAEATTTPVDSIVLDTLDPAGHMTTRTEVLAGDGAVSLPVTLGVVWRGGAMQPITFTAHGLAGGTEVVSRRVVTGFVSGETRVVRLDLYGACVGVTCNAGESCGAGGCASENVAASDLPRFDGTVPRIVDGGLVADGGLDAASDDSGADAGHDAGRDASIDAGNDAGSDAGPLVCTPACMLDHAVAICTTAHTCAISSCDTGFSNCDTMDPTGCERSIRTDTDCNGCNLPCTSSAGTTTCADGTCRIATCTVTMTGDCDGQLSNGCEVNLRNDMMHCGSCTNACTGTQRCMSGACH